MTDLSKFTDQELFDMLEGLGEAPASPPQASDITKMSDEELLRMYNQQVDSEVPAVGVKQKGTDRGEIRAALQGFNSTIPFGNRLTASLGALGASAITGEKFNDLYKLAREDQLATEQANRNANTAGAALGIASALPIGISKAVSTTPLLGKAANALTKASTAASNFVVGGNVANNAKTVSKIGTAAARGVKSAIIAAPIGALYGAGEAPEGKKMERAQKGAIVAASVAGALPVAGAVVSGLVPKVSPGLSGVVQLAKKYNIPISLDQVTDSRALKNIQKVSQELPFSGQAAFRAKQMLSYNRAILKTVGVNADMFTPKTMNTAFKKVGREFDTLTKGKTFNIADKFLDDVARTAEEVASTYGSEAEAIYRKEAFRVLSDFKKDNSITGDLINRQRARINSLARKATDPSIKGALHDLEMNIVDGITGGDEAAQALLSQAKQRYKNLIVLEPVATKAKGGFISPSALNSRVSQVYKRSHTVGNSGEIGELARIGLELLPELGGSDTTQKLAYFGALTVGGINTSLIPAMLGTVAANRAFQAGINRNQAVVNHALSKLPPQAARNPGFWEKIVKQPKK